MTDSVITDSCPTAATNPNRVPTSADHELRQEVDGNSQSAAAEDENPAVIADTANGCTANTDSGRQHLVENCERTNDDVSRVVAGGHDADCTKCLSPDLWTNGCGRPSLGTSSSAAVLLTNGHVDM